MVACSVDVPEAIGIDLEWVRPRAVLSIAESVFAPEELRSLARCPANERPAAFVDLWVLKESAAKLLGLDLMSALTQCHFEISAGVIAGKLPGNPPWRGAVFAPRPALRLAWIQVETPHGPKTGNESAGGENSLQQIEWHVSTGQASAGHWPEIARTV
jgi:hypothetical protein